MLYTLLQVVYSHHYRSGYLLHNLTQHAGTAVVTGASAGIGKVYAERLAARGYDLILVARRSERLAQIAEALSQKYSIKAQALVADLATANGVASVAECFDSDPTITLLVNNAGFSTLKPLTHTPNELISGMISLNVTALTLLSKAALNAFKIRNAGVLINVGSAAGFSPYPDIPVYGATKAYVFQFTQSLQHELEGTDVKVQLVLPGAVISEGWDVAGGGELEPLPADIVMTTEDCVDAALRGLDLGESITAPSLYNATLLADYVALSDTMLQSSFAAVPAQRYRVAS
jgi:short-subunit dehydrogenase